MNRPILEDYGLTEDEYAEYKSLDDRYETACEKRRRITAWTFLIIGVVLIILGFSFLVVFSDGGDIVGLIPGGIICLIAGVVCVIPPITRKLVILPKKDKFMDVSRYSKQIDYDKALLEYVNRVLEINSQFWKSLNQSQLEKGLTHLFVKAGYKVDSEKTAELTKIQLLFSRKGKKTGVCCTTEKLGSLMLGSVMNSLHKNSGLSDLIYIALGGLSNLIDNDIFTAAMRKGFTLSLWDVQGILNLAESVDSLISDESELDVLKKSSGASPESGVVYLDADPISVVDLKVGRCVTHKSLGTGIVEEIGDGRHEITVSFSDDTGSVYRKKFKYPDSFDDGTLSYLQDGGLMSIWLYDYAR